MARYRTLPSEIEKNVPERLIGKSFKEIQQWASKALYNKGVEVELTRPQLQGIKDGKIKRIVLKPKGPFFFRQNILTGEIKAIETMDVKLEFGEDFDDKLEFEEKIFSHWLQNELQQISRERIKDLAEKEKIWIYYCHVKRVKEFLRDNSDHVTKSLVWERLSRSKTETFGKMYWYFSWYLVDWLPDLNKNSPELEWGQFTLSRLLGIEKNEVRNHWKKSLLDDTFSGIDLKKIWFVIRPYTNKNELISEIRTRLDKKLISEDSIESILGIYEAMNKKISPRNQDIERLRKIIPERC